MDLQLTLTLNFDGYLSFGRFLPVTRDEALSFSLNDDKYQMTLYISDLEKQVEAYVPRDPNAWAGYWDIRVRSLTLHILAKDIDPEAVGALETDQPTEKTEAFGLEVFEQTQKVHNGIINYCRNVLKQHWLEPISTHERNYQGFLYACNAVWLSSTGEWRRLRIARVQPNYDVISFAPGGMDKAMWSEMADFIQQGKRVPMRDVLLANSLKHIDQENGRLSVVEAVIALEASIKQLLPKAIINLPGAPEIEEAILDRLVEKAGLRIVMEVGLSMVKDLAGLSAEDIQKVAEAIEARNNVIHGPQRSIELEKARVYVSSISRVINTLEHWATAN